MIAPNSTGERIVQALEARGFKKAGPNEWRGNSPLRTGSNSGAFAVHIDDDGEHGAWKDHVTGEGGSLYDLAARLGIETPKAQAQETKRGYTGLAEYAEAHYAPAAFFEAAGWSEGKHKDRPCLIYTVGGKLRYRYIDGKEPPYEWELGGKPAWYGLRNGPGMATGRALILCNGEASTISAQYHGLPACAWAGGEQKLPDRAITELKAAYSGPVILAYDCDSTGERVAQEVAAQLDAAGFAVRIAALGMTTHGDLADFAGLYRETAYAELDKRAVAYVPSPAVVEAAARALEVEVKAAVSDPAEAIEKKVSQLAGQVERIQALVTPPRVIDLHELAEDTLNPAHDARVWPAAPIPQLAALVGPFKPELYVILGAANMGKSWLAATLAGHLIQKGGGPGLVISTEMEPRAFFRRIVSYVSRVSLTPIDEGTATHEEKHAWNAAAARFKTFDTRLMDLSSPSPKQVLQAARRAQKDIGLNWLIVDSATRMRGSGEGIYERTTSVSNALQDFARDFNIPVIMTNQIARDIANRPNGHKQPQMNDGYGGGPIEQNAGVVLGLYDHHYYVRQGLETMNDSAFPPGTARLILLKHRNRAIPEVPHCTVRYEAGCGFYAYGPQIVARVEGRAS